MIKQREAKNLQYNDILNNLIEVSKEHPEMTEEIMIKTCVQFFGDGYESAALIFGVLIYYLAVYPEVQEKLQEELDEIFDSKDEGEEITQDDINNMKYLEQVLLEGQRLAPLPNSGRTCTKDWQIPGDSFVVPKGTRVIIPIVGETLKNQTSKFVISRLVYTLILSTGPILLCLILTGSAARTSPTLTVSPSKHSGLVQGL